PIHPGSYVRVEHGLPQQGLSAFSFECWLMPWGFGQRQAVLSQGEGAAFGLFIEADGRLAFGVGAGTEPLTGPCLVPRQWVHLAPVFQAGRLSLWVDGQAVAHAPGPPSGQPGSAPLRLGAAALDGRTGLFLDADLVMPVLHGRALSAAEIAERHAL